MRRTKRGSWWGLYVLIPVSALLLVVVARMKVGESLHRIFLVGVVAIVAVLALQWSETHPDLMESEGVDAQAEESALTAAGVGPGRFAPSLTARQAHYRLVMFVRH